MTNPHPAPGFLDRLKFICEDNGVTLEQFAAAVQVKVPMLEAYATGELELDELTIGRIYEFDPDIDWLWLECGYEQE